MIFYFEILLFLEHTIFLIILLASQYLIKDLFLFLVGSPILFFISFGNSTETYSDLALIFMVKIWVLTFTQDQVLLVGSWNAWWRGDSPFWFLLYFVIFFVGVAVVRFSVWFCFFLLYEYLSSKVLASFQGLIILNDFLFLIFINSFSRDL